MGTPFYFIFKAREPIFMVTYKGLSEALIDDDRAIIEILAFFLDQF